jgi:hypothetical protein
MQQRERRIVADGTNVAEMVGDTLKFGHQCSDPNGSWRDFYLKGGLNGMSEGKRVSNGAIVGGASDKLCSLFASRSRHQRFDSLVRISEPLLEANDRFAIGGEAEMPWLDDPRVHRADRNLMQALAFRRQKVVSRGAVRSRPLRPERMLHAPHAMVKPGAGVGKAGGG